MGVQPLSEPPEGHGVEVGGAQPAGSCPQAVDTSTGEWTEAGGTGEDKLCWAGSTIGPLTGNQSKAAGRGPGSLPFTLSLILQPYTSGQFPGQTPAPPGPAPFLFSRLSAAEERSIFCGGP